VGLIATGVACTDEPSLRLGGRVAGWPFYGGNAGGERYSPLDQIDRTNAANLEVAWQIRTGDLDVDPPPPGHMAFQATPILVDGRLILPTPLGRVLALDPETGRELWRFDATFSERRFPEFTSRGVASFVDSTLDENALCRIRIFAATLESRLYAIDARTGVSCEGFGDKGEIDLRKDLPRLSVPTRVTISSPPTVVGDLVVLGSAISDNGRVVETRGVVRAYDARTGDLVWHWDPIPSDAARAVEDGWKPDHAQRTGAANAWAPLSVDAGRDLVFVPTSSPSPDYYGGERLGSDRHANSVVALRASTGELVWAFQLVHHDLWDYDTPAQPTLTHVRRDGRDFPVVVQTTKTGLVFVLHRETGEPVFPVEERAVPASDVPGEQAWPTQPFPTAMARLVPNSLRPEDAFGLTPYDRGKCRDRIASLRNEGLFTPPSLQGTLAYPGIAGGSNWGGIAIDPERRLIVANVTNLAFEVRLIPRADFEHERENKGLLREYAPQEGTPYGIMREPILGPFFMPCTPPPWGMLVAVSLDTGAEVWRRPFGTVPDILPLPAWFEPGLPNLGGPIITAGGVVLIGASMDGRFRAFDVETGEELFRDKLPAGGNATPMTYRLGEDQRQYIVIAAGGHGKMGTRLGDYVVAYALPDS
jgi:quinoprotein glucose dehydrogenase